MLWFNGNSSNLGGTDDAVVIGDIVSAGTKAITVQICSAIATIRESEESWSIPGLHHTRSPLVECLFSRVHATVSLPCFGNHEHDRFRKREDTINGEQFKDIVECGRVGTSILNDWIQEVEFIAKKFRLQDPFSCTHPILISSQRIDFTIMGSPSQRLSSIPAGKCVGGKSRMNQSEMGFVIDTGQIVVVFIDLGR